jgi:hypothetical protein
MSSTDNIQGFIDALIKYKTTDGELNADNIKYASYISSYSKQSKQADLPPVLEECDPTSNAPPSLGCKKENYHKAYSAHRTAPDKLKVARETYYKALPNTDPNYWPTWLQTQQGKEEKKLKSKFIAEHDETMEKVNSMINYYEAESIYSKRMKQLYKELLEKNGKYKNKISNFRADVATNDRKTYYENEEIKNLKDIYDVLVIIYWISFAVFCIMALFIAKKYKDYRVWLIIVFFALVPNVLLSLIAIGLYDIKEFISNTLSGHLPKNVYVNLKKP